MDGPRHGIGDRAGWRTWLPVTALVGITLVFYHGLWMPGLVLIKRDAFWFHLPIKQYLIERLASGELPQWFPYEALGRPFIGTTATGVFHPFTAFYFFLPVPDAYRASTLLSCLLAAAGAFTLGRMLNFSRAGALVAGLAFALSGYVVSMTDNIVYLYSICALPLFCAALEKALVSMRAWTVAPAVIWATVFLNGDVQTGYYYGFIALLWTAMRAPGPRCEAALRLVFVGGLAALLAGIQLAPAAMVFLGSERAQPTLFHEQALSWATHPLRLLTVLASPIGENADPVAVGRLFFETPVFVVLAESVYLGIPVIGLALLGAGQRRDLRVLALLGALALLLALGRFGGLYEVFYRVVPLWSAFRYPEKLMGVVAFAAALLAGAGLDALRAGRGRPGPWLGAAVLCASAGLGLHTEAASVWVTTHFEAPAALASEMTSSAALAFLFSALAALGVWLVITGARSGWLRDTLALVTLVAIVTLDLARANLGAYHIGPAEAATFTPPLFEALSAREGTLRPGHFRLISTTQSKTLWPDDLHRRLGYHTAVSVARRQALDLGHNAEFHIETVHPYLPGYSRALAIMVQQRLRIEVAARLNVTYYIDRRFLLKDQRVARALVAELPAFDLALFHNPVPAKPRAYLSLKPERTASPVDPVALLARPDFLSGEVDVIETSDSALPGPATGGHVTMERYAPEEVRVRVETPRPSVLILLDAYDKGWTATLDNGVEIPVMRANALVRAAVVPAGDHVVTFRYETPLLRAGTAASLTGAVICLAMIAQARQRTRRQEDRA